jgi:hypothetical protein
MPEESIPKDSYIGDGVYAGFDGHDVWLPTERESGTHYMALGPRELAMLVRYLKEKGFEVSL